jgi:hypothetical protein
MYAVAPRALSIAILVTTALFLTPPAPTRAADTPLFEMDNATIDARIRAAFADADAFAAAKVVGLLFADTVAVGPNQVAREAILTGLEKESAHFRTQMPDFRIEERGLYVADNGVVMTGRMMGTRMNGTKMNVAFVTVFNRDKSGRIVTQSTMEAPGKTN